MIEKLDPTLREISETQADRRDARSLTVLVGLRMPVDPTRMEELRALGLEPRSIVGDIVTGTISPADLTRLAGHPLVVKIEASRPMQLERFE